MRRSNAVNVQTLTLGVRRSKGRIPALTSIWQGSGISKVGGGGRVSEDGKRGLGWGGGSGVRINWI